MNLTVSNSVTLCSREPDGGAGVLSKPGQAISVMVVCCFDESDVRAGGYRKLDR